jgi:hypothetical protein
VSRITEPRARAKLLGSLLMKVANDVLFHPFLPQRSGPCARASLWCLLCAATRAAGAA